MARPRKAPTCSRTDLPVNRCGCYMYEPDMTKPITAEQRRAARALAAEREAAESAPRGES